MKLFFRKYSYLFFNAGVVLVCYVILSTQVFQRINTQIIDLFQGETPVRNEIVLVAIDDKSIAAVDTLPWKRETIASLLKPIIDSSPAVIGVNILTVEKKDGDNELTKVIESSKVPVVLASVFDDNKVYSPQIFGNNIIYAFNNIPVGFDGKVRDYYTKYGNNNNCLYTFSFVLYQSAKGTLRKHECDKTQSLTLRGDLKIGLSYTRKPFKTLSASDVVKGSFEKKDIEGKIVIVGITSTNVLSSLSENYYDVFGNKVTGTIIHAQAVNTYLQNLTFWYVPEVVLLGISLVLTTIFAYLAQRVQHQVSVLYFAATEMFIGLACLILYEFGIIVPIFKLVCIVLCSYLFMMVQELWQKYLRTQVISDKFSKHVNPGVLQKVLTQPELLKLDGEKRKMTVLFCDVRGFTALSEKVSPEKLIDILNKYIDGMTDIILRYEGTIDKYIGDIVMAFWNAPINDHKHALHSVLVALEIKKHLRHMNQQFDETSKITIGMGINTGDMVIGNVGGRNRFNYTVLGERVNIALRLEELTEKYGVCSLVSEATVKSIGRELEGKVLFRLVDSVMLKGMSEPMNIYEPLHYNLENLVLINNYMKAFLNYQKNELDDAIVLFFELENDPVSQLMIKRIRHLKKLKKNAPKFWKWSS